LLCIMHYPTDAEPLNIMGDYCLPGNKPSLCKFNTSHLENIKK